MKKISFEDACILNAIKTARFLVTRLPLSFSLGAAKVLGGAVAIFSKRGRIAYKNLRMVFAEEKSPKEMRRLARQSIENLSVSAVEMLRIPEMTNASAKERFTLEGEEHIRPYLQKGQGIIFLTGHYGSWELLSIIGALRGYPMTALARVQKHPRSDKYLNDLRRSKGTQIVHKGMPVREILRALKGGKIVGILSDQDGGRQGRWVRFMGRLSSTPPGAAIFSLRTGAPIFPAFIIRKGNGTYHIQIEKALAFPPPEWPSDKAETFIMQQFADTLERKIRQAPEQWLWAHRRWKSSPERRILILSDGKAGHLNQSMAVVEAMRRERLNQHRDSQAVRSTVVEVKFRGPGRGKVLSLLTTLTRGRLPFLGAWVRWALDPETFRALSGAYADVVISCGASLVGINLWLKGENDAGSVVVMKPSLPFKRFDAVIAPRHDEIESHPSVFTTEGALAALRPEDLEVEGAALSAELQLKNSSRRLGVLIGGDTGSLRFDPETFIAMMNAVKKYCSDAGIQILVTSSRRTPAWADARLKEIFNDRKLCPLLLIANEANRKNAVAAILGACDTVLVTAESMSMVSESVYAGKPVIAVRPWVGAPLKKKYDVYLGRLEKLGHVIVSDRDGLGPALEHAFSGEWTTKGDYRFMEETILAGAAKKVMR